VALATLYETCRAFKDNRGKMKDISEEVLMNLSVLDVYVLSLLDRGLETPYDLQRQGGLSLGASTPALRRLVKANFVERADGESATNRPRHEYQLTPSGKQAARSGWKPFLDSDDPSSDLDSLLRIVDMAAHYQSDKQKVRGFLKRAADGKSLLAQHATLNTAANRSDDRILYLSMRVRCDASRLQAEADALLELSRLFPPKERV
jgi:DNA-binding PadR family transcriptional regulator